jgi:outer membrane protein
MWIAFAAVAVVLACNAAQAQSNIVKLGPIRYDTHSKTSGVQGAGLPPGGDADTGDATTLMFAYERMMTPNIGIELVLGIPPRIHAHARGSLTFFGDDVLSAKFVSPTLVANYHFGAPGDTWRPYVGGGVNYTRFTSFRSRLATHVDMSDSVGWVVNAGLDYMLSPRLNVFAAVSALRVRSDVVAIVGGSPVTTTFDFRPTTYQVGLSYKF